MKQGAGCIGSWFNWRIAGPTEGSAVLRARSAAAASTELAPILRMRVLLLSLTEVVPRQTTINDRADGPRRVDSPARPTAVRQRGAVVAATIALPMLRSSETHAGRQGGKAVGDGCPFLLRRLCLGHGRDTCCRRCKRCALQSISPRCTRPLACAASRPASRVRP